MSRARSTRAAAAAAARVARVWVASSKPERRTAGVCSRWWVRCCAQAAAVSGAPMWGEQCGDGVGFADGDPVGVTGVFGFGGDAQAAGGTGQGRRGFRGGAHNVECGQAVGFGQRTGHQERPPPDRGGVTNLGRVERLR